MPQSVLISNVSRTSFETLNLLLSAWGFYYTFIAFGLDLRKIGAITNHNFLIWSVYILLCIWKRSGLFWNSEKMEPNLNIVHQVLTAISFVTLFFYWPFLSKQDLLINIMNRSPEVQRVQIYVSLLKHLYIPLTVWLEVLTHTFDYVAHIKKLWVVVYGYFFIELFFMTNVLGIRIYRMIDYTRLFSYIYILSFGVFLFLGFKVSFGINKRLKQLSGGQQVNLRAWDK